MIFVSCKENSLENENTKGKKSTNILDFLMGVNLSATQGTIAIESYSGGNTTSHNYNLAGAVFTDSNRTNKVDGGKFVVGTDSISTNSDLDYYSDVDHSSDYGTTLNVSLTGNGTNNIDSWTTSFYVPKDIDISLSDNDSFSKANGISITWNSDINNTNGVYIAYSYLKYESNKYIDTTLPDTEIIWKKNVSDNGSYTITSSELSSLPNNGLINLYVFRGNYIIDGSTNQKYLIYSSTLDMETLKITP